MHMQKLSDKLDYIFNSYYEHKMISSGDNFPDFNPAQDSVDLFLVALHEKLDLNTFQKKVGWSDEFLQEKINFLKSKNWLKGDKNPKPTIFIVSNEQGMDLYEHGRPIAEQIAESVLQEIPSVKDKFFISELSSKYNFEEWSFFILSDVLLDNWQINNVEAEFLKKNNRPQRHGKNYYYSLMENIQFPKENFGIYGNQYHSIGDDFTLIVYGNNRNIANSKIRTDITFLDSLIANAPKLTDSELNLFEQFASDFKPKLLKILSKNKSYIENVFKKTGYINEISFEEFFIWWYHFIYTDITNILQDKNELVIPEDGNFYCLII